MNFHYKLNEKLEARATRSMIDGRSVLQLHQRPNCSMISTQTFTLIYEQLTTRKTFNSKGRNVGIHF
jgi:hypothetical protein